MTDSDRRSDARPLTPRDKSVAQAITLQRRQLRHENTYGTFKKESVHGLLFELDTFMECIQGQAHMHMLANFVGTILWPVAWLIAACTYRSAAKSQRKDLSLLTMWMMLATVIGLILWLLPLILIAIDGGPERYWHLVNSKVIAPGDFINLFKSELIMLLFITFSYVLHEICYEADSYKTEVLQSWHGKHGELGIEVVMTPEQMQYIRPKLEDASDRGNSVFIEDILHLLKGMPGWESDAGLQGIDFWEKLWGESRSFFAKLHKHSQDAEERGIWALDMYVFWNQYHEQATPLHHRLAVNYHKLFSTWSWLLGELFKVPFTCFLIVCVAAIRSLMPRVWTWGVLGGLFFPSEVCPLILSIHTTFVFFIVSFAWFSLFFISVQEYRKQVAQVVLVSAMIDPKMRMAYMQAYLKHFVGKHEVERIMRCLPVLNLKIDSNLTAFWKLREYCNLDRSNERISMHILMDMILFWFSLNLTIVLANLFIFQTVPSDVPVFVFDTLTFGVTMIWALNGAMSVNQIMENHQNVLKRARYDLCLDLWEMSLVEEPTPEEKKLAQVHHETCCLLDQHVSMLATSQMHDKILLGWQVTPSSLFSTTFTIFVALMTISFKLHAMGIFDGVKENFLRHVSGVDAPASFTQLVQHLPQVRFLQNFHGLKF